MRRERFIDINADVGESAEHERDAELMRYVTSANVACGAHAGDLETIRRTIEIAKSLKLAVGAHPGYPDRENFGRIGLAIGMDELLDSLREQIQLVRGIGSKLGVRVMHVKPHGALYHDANHRREIAQVIAEAAAQVDPAMIVIAQSGSAALKTYRALGLRTAEEAFADRAYDPSGELRSRKVPGALLETPGSAASQAMQIASEGSLLLADGTKLRMQAETLCVHSDTPGAAEIARIVRETLKGAGIRVKSLA